MKTNLENAKVGDCAVLLYFKPDIIKDVSFNDIVNIFIKRYDGSLKNRNKLCLLVKIEKITEKLVYVYVSSNNLCSFRKENGELYRRTHDYIGKPSLVRLSEIEYNQLLEIYTNSERNIQIKSNLCDLLRNMNSKNVDSLSIEVINEITKLLQ